MDRDRFNQIVDDLKSSVQSVPEPHRFPLNAAVTVVGAQRDARRTALSPGSEISDGALDLLALFDATAVSAALAIKSFSQTHDDTTGLTSALVDLWGQSEAARCLWFDQYAVFSGEASQLRGDALMESARLVAPEAIALAIRLQEPVAQYVEFVSKVVS